MASPSQTVSSAIAAKNFPSFPTAHMRLTFPPTCLPGRSSLGRFVIAFGGLVRVPGRLACGLAAHGLVARRRAGGFRVGSSGRFGEGGACQHDAADGEHERSKHAKHASTPCRLALA